MLGGMFGRGKTDVARRFVDGVAARVSAAELASILDEASPKDRVDAVLSVDGSLVGRLYELVGGQALTINDIVPPTTPAGATVTFEGRNSLPVFSRFQKRFTRTADGLVFGYNHQPLRLAGMVTGPGYFRVLDAGAPDGELLFDYTLPPPFEPSGWPAYRPNDFGASRFVFMNLNDYVRRVATGVVVGAAFRNGKDQNAYFSLTTTQL